MRKFLLSATVLAGFAIPALAMAAAQGSGIAGDLNLSQSAASSTAGVSSVQGTSSMSNVTHGAAIGGAVSGNITAVQTTALGKAGPAGSTTTTTATQMNLGATVSGGIADPSGRKGSGAIVVSGGGQSSQAYGDSAAAAKNTNLGGFVTTTKAGRSPATR